MVPRVGLRGDRSVAGVELGPTAAWRASTSKVGDACRFAHSMPTGVVSRKAASSGLADAKIYDPTEK